jgi:hypothetical protein
VKGLAFDGLTIHDRDTSGHYERHMIWGREVVGVTVNRLRTRMDTPNQTLSQLHFENVRDLRVTASRPGAAPVPFLTLSGGATTNVALLFNDLLDIATVVDLEPEVPSAAVRLEGNVKRDSPGVSLVEP